MTLQLKFINMCSLSYVRYQWTCYMYEYSMNKLFYTLIFCQSTVMAMFIDTRLIFFYFFWAKISTTCLANYRTESERINTRCETILCVSTSGNCSVMWEWKAKCLLTQFHKCFPNGDAEKTLFNQDYAWIHVTSILDYFEISECQKYEQDY